MFGADVARAGSFLQEVGTWQAIHSFTVTDSRVKFDQRGVARAADPYRKVETSLLMEYGLTPNLTLIVNPVLRDVALTQSTGVVAGHGLGTLEAGARWRMFEFWLGTISFQALARAPARGDPALAFETHARTELRLGYGAPALINGKPGFIDASAAWAKRHDAQPDEIKFEMTYGWMQRSDRMILLQYFTNLYPGAGLRRDPWQHKIQTSTVYLLNKKWSLQIGSFYTRGGHLTRRENGTILALWRRF